MVIPYAVEIGIGPSYPLLKPLLHANSALDPCPFWPKGFASHCFFWRVLCLVLALEIRIGAFLLIQHEPPGHLVLNKILVDCCNKQVFGAFSSQTTSLKVGILCYRSVVKGFLWDEKLGNLTNALGFSRRLLPRDSTQ